MRAIVGEDYITRVAGQYPGGRVGQPEDIVALTAFLCSDAASHLVLPASAIAELGAISPPRSG